jgi:hypothetical protein
MDVIITALFGLAFAIAGALGIRKVRRRAFLIGYPFPGSLERRLQREFPQYDACDRSEILAGLRDWFCIAQDAGGRRLSMPSRIVDAAWHEFILDTRSYREFCQRAFGRYYDHVPAEAMRSPTPAQEGIRRSWRLACARENIDREKPVRLPRLFALDARLAVQGGFVYALDCSLVAQSYCASSIGCASGCGGSDGGDGSDGGGCGGD